MDHPSSAASLPESIGPYQLVSDLARGGTSTVYICRQQNPARLVALKLLRPGFGSSDQMNRRFQLEIELLATLNHPGIASIFDAGFVEWDAEPRPYFTMELVRGLRLNDFVRSQGAEPRPIPEMLQLFLQVCEALQYAHNHGIIHRDLKPGNILVDAEGSPKLIDFGIARLQPPSGTVDTVPTLTQATVGTPPYMSPEQFDEDARAIDVRSDVYSLAVVFYEALAGRLPYDVSGKPFYEAARTIREVRPVPLRRVRHDASADLEVVLDMGLAKDPSDRYSSVQVLADDLRRCLRGEPVTARRTGPFGQLGQWSRRNPRTALTAALSMLALTITSVLALLFGVTAHRQAVELRETISRVDSERGRAARHAELAERRSGELAAANRDLEDVVRRLRHLTQNITLSRADQTWEEDSELARRLLHDESVFPIESRNFSWHLLNRRASRNVVSWQAHATPIAHLALSDDGQVLATVAAEHVALWQSADGKLLHRIQDRIGLRSRVAVNGAGTQVLVQRDDGGVFLWRVPEWDKVPLRMARDGPATAVAFAPDGTHLAVGDLRGHVEVWGSGCSQSLWKAHVGDRPIVALRFASGTSRIGVVADGEIVIADLTDGTVLSRESLPLKRPESVALSGDLRLVAVAQSQGSCLLWDRDRQTVMETIMPSGQMPVVETMGSRLPALLVARRSRVELWSQGEKRMLMNDPNLVVRTLATSGNQQHVAMGGDDGTVSIVSTETFQPVRSIATLENHVVQLRFSEDGRRLAASGRDEEVVVYDLDSGSVHVRLPGHEPPVRDVVFCPGGTQLVTTDRSGTLRRWNVDTGVAESVFESPGERVRALTPVSPAGRLFGLGARGKLFQYNVHDGRLVKRVAGEMATGTILSKSPDGTILATVTEEGDIVLWDTRRIAPIARRNISTQRILSVQFSMDSRELVLTSTEGSPSVWQVPSLEFSRELQLHSARVTSIDFSPDGSLLATGGADGKIVCWDAETWEPQLVLDDEIDHLRVIRFSPDSRRLAVAGQGGRISLWEAMSPDAQ